MLPRTRTKDLAKMHGFLILLIFNSISPRSTWRITNQHRAVNAESLAGNSLRFVGRLWTVIVHHQHDTLDSKQVVTSVTRQTFSFRLELMCRKLWRTPCQFLTIVESPRTHRLTQMCYRGYQMTVRCTFTPQMRHTGVHLENRQTLSCVGRKKWNPLESKSDSVIIPLLSSNHSRLFLNYSKNQLQDVQICLSGID